MQTIYFEFPSFGFGPASTSCHLIHAVQNRLNCQIVVISSGAGLDFARRSLQNVIFFDIDTNHEKYFEKIKELVPIGSVIITNTNIAFCRWSVEHGYLTIAIDTLFWMWEQDLNFIPRTICYIVQDYFIPERQFNKNYEKYKKHLIITSPIIRNHEFIKINAGINSDEALISFGGMETPFNKEIIFQYCDYILFDLVHKLCESGIRKIHIVGGLCEQYTKNAQWLDQYKQAVVVHGTVSQNQYLNLLSSAWHFITPGLTSIYESCSIDAPPYFLPGFNMSQIMQSENFRDITGYPYVGQWEGIGKIAEKISTMQEEEGTIYFNRFLKNYMIHTTHFEWPNLTEYIHEKRRSLSTIIPIVKTVKKRWCQLDDATNVLLAALQQAII